MKGVFFILATAAVFFVSAHAPANERLPGEVTSREENGRITHEYRIDGRLYAIEVIEDGQRHVLIDHNGNGNFARQGSESEITPPAWVAQDQ